MRHKLWQRWLRFYYFCYGPYDVEIEAAGNDPWKRKLVLMKADYCGCWLCLKVPTQVAAPTHQELLATAGAEKPL